MLRRSGRTRAGGAATAAVSLLLAAAVGAGPAAADSPVHTARVSLGLGEANDASHNPVASRDGRWVAFSSNASNLVKGDINRKPDVFVRDTKTGRTTRVSVSSKGMQANDISYNPVISDDGRYVAFDSFANNLVPGDLNRKGDVFVHDRVTGRTQRISNGVGGKESNGQSGFATMSGDGRFVAYESVAGNLVPNQQAPVSHLYLWDRRTGKTELISRTPSGAPANGSSGDASLSRDGRFVAFSSSSNNLVPGDTNQRDDVFVLDRKDGAVKRVSMNVIGFESNGGSGMPSISDDGTVVAFESLSSNLLSRDVRMLDHLGLLTGGQNPHTAGDTNGASDIYVADLRAGTLTMASVSGTGEQGTRNSYGPSISADGTRVAFTSYAPNLAAQAPDRGHTEVFVRDLKNGTTRMVSVDDADNAADEASSGAVISADGNAVVFSSGAGNLVRDDRNHESDIFIHR
jgi:Tol biopolymer transport system component